MPWAQAHGPASARALGGERTVHQHNLSIEPPLDPFNRSLHQLRLDRIYSSWLTNYSPPKRLRPGNRGLAPTALKMPPLPGLRTDEAALIGVKNQVSQPTVQQRTFTEELWLFSPAAENFHRRAYGCLAPAGATS